MSLRDAFAGIKEARQHPDPAQTDIEDVTGSAPTPAPEATPQAAPRTARKSRTTPRTEPPSEDARGVGKYRDPEYERLTVYVRKVTRKAAARKWEDAGQRDLSSLVQALLVRYLTE